MYTALIFAKNPEISMTAAHIIKNCEKFISASYPRQRALVMPVCRQAGVHVCCSSPAGADLMIRAD